MSCTGCGLLERRVLEGDALDALVINRDALSRASSPNGNVSEIQHVWAHDIGTVTRTRLDRNPVHDVTQSRHVPFLCFLLSVVGFCKFLVIH